MRNLRIEMFRLKKQGKSSKDEKLIKSYQDINTVMVSKEYSPEKMIQCVREEYRNINKDIKDSNRKASTNYLQQLNAVVAQTILRNSIDASEKSNNTHLQALLPLDCWIRIFNYINPKLISDFTSSCRMFSEILIQPGATPFFRYRQQPTIKMKHTEVFAYLSSPDDSRRPPKVGLEKDSCKILFSDDNFFKIVPNDLQDAYSTEEYDYCPERHLLAFSRRLNNEWEIVIFDLLNNKPILKQRVPQLYRDTHFFFSKNKLSLITSNSSNHTKIFMVWDLNNISEPRKEYTAALWIDVKGSGLFQPLERDGKVMLVEIHDAVLDESDENANKIYFLAGHHVCRIDIASWKCEVLKEIFDLLEPASFPEMQFNQNSQSLIIAIHKGNEYGSIYIIDCHTKEMIFKKLPLTYKPLEGIYKGPILKTKAGESLVVFNRREVFILGSKGELIRKFPVSKSDIKDVHWDTTHGIIITLGGNEIVKYKFFNPNPKINQESIDFDDAIELLNLCNPKNAM